MFNPFYSYEDAGEAAGNTLPDTPTAIAKELAFIPLVSITVLILLPKVSMFTPRK